MTRFRIIIEAFTRNKDRIFSEKVRQSIINVVDLASSEGLQEVEEESAQAVYSVKVSTKVERNIGAEDSQGDHKTS